ncbi:MAG: amidohydrolase [Dehalococcoidia bacterium]|nr:amidohydrolase [Dehalococcoidia bacterium]
MIVDVHWHLWVAMEKHPSTRAASAKTEELGGERIAGFDIGLVPDWEKREQDLVRWLDEDGVDVACLVLAEYGLILNDNIFSVDGENRIQAEIMRRHPDRLLSFFGIDPRRPESADMFERYLRNGDAKGLKLHPTAGFFPHDRSAYPLYELCVEYDVPVLYHCGPMRAPFYGRFARPMEFDDVAADFPDLNIILGHAGEDLWEETVSVARMKPNMYVDFSYWQPALRFEDEWVRAVARMRDVMGVERLLFGSDHPGMTRIANFPLGDWLNVWRDLPALGKKYGHKFTADEVDGILGDNAARLLKLPQR